MTSHFHAFLVLCATHAAAFTAGAVLYARKGAAALAALKADAAKAASKVP